MSLEKQTPLSLNSAKGLMLVIVLFVAAQVFKLSFLAPPPEYIWDNVYLWDWARNFSLGNFAPFVPDSHHQMRWGDWAFPAILIQLFSDEVFYYYLATAIPSIVAGIIFVYYVWRYIGIWQAAMFALLWFFDSELFRATFQLLPTGQSLLPTALLLLFLTHISARKEVTTALAIALSLCLFWLYGVKETYLAMAPATAWIMWRIGGIRPILVLTSVMVIGYFGETLLFRLISSDFPLWGRIHALIDGGQHVKIMLEDEYYVNQQTRYFDSGITRRWIAAVGVSSVIYFPAYIFAVLVLADRQKGVTVDGNQWAYSPTQIVALLLLSFMFFTTFFVISISPLRLGHGLVSRYLAICLPLCYFLILAFCSQQLKPAKTGYKLAVLVVIPFLISPAIQRFMDYPQLSIMGVSERYNEFAKTMEAHDCIRARQKSIVRNQLEMIPFAYRSESVKAMLANPEIEFENRWFLIRGGVAECKNTYTITRIATARY